MPQRPSRAGLVLALDAATPPASVAVAEPGALLAHERGPFGRGTDAWVLPALERALERAGVTLAEVSGIVASVGPGTFTGIRVGLATVLGLGRACGIPVSGIDTLVALAATAAGGRPASLPGCVLGCVDARRGRLYAATYEFAKPFAWPERTLSKPRLIDADALLEQVAAGVPAAGTGLATDARLARRFDPVPTPDGIAPAIARVAAELFAAGRSDLLPPPRPLYLREADAVPGRSPLAPGRRSRRA